jgi:hypothetical protein
MEEFVEAETGKGSDALDRRPQLAAALAAAPQRQMLRGDLQARQAFTRRSVCFRADGATSALYSGGTGPGCRSLHAAPLRGAGRERTTFDFPNVPRRRWRRRRPVAPSWATLRTLLRRECTAGKSRSPPPTSSPLVFCRSSKQSEGLAQPRSKRSRRRSTNAASGPRAEQLGTLHRSLTCLLVRRTSPIYVSSCPAFVRREYDPRRPHGARRSRSENHCSIKRATMSGALPAGAPTMMRTGRAG